MILTEEQAKEKACCKVLPHTPDGKLMTAACLASQCMAWRWYDGTQTRAMCRPERPYWDATSEPPKRPDIITEEWEWIPYDEGEDIGGHWREPQEDADKRRRGYCGRVGLPGFEIKEVLNNIEIMAREIGEIAFQQTQKGAGS